MVALLNEVTIFRTLLAAWQGRPVYIMDQVPLTPPGRWLVGRLTALALWKGWFRNAYETIGDIKHIINRPAFCDYTDIFVKVDHAVPAFFRFDMAPSLRGLDLPYKHLSWKDAYTQADYAITIAAIRKGREVPDAEVMGASPILKCLAETYAGRPLGIVVKEHRVLQRLYNFAQAAFVLAYTLLSVARRIRPNQSRESHFLLGSTYANMDFRLLKTLEDIADRRDQVCIVFSTPAQVAQAKSLVDISGYEWRLRMDGRFALRAGLSAMAEAAAEIARAWRHVGWVRSAHFLEMTKLVWMRMAWRGLFQRYGFDYFWCRDEHNAEHMVRTQELRRIGAKSFGSTHGVPTTQLLMPLRRYQDFDVMFLFGTHVYDRYYSRTWPSHIEVVSMGAFALTREEIANIRIPRTKDIVIFTNLSLEHQIFIDTAMTLAQAFPDRKIYFKNKRTYEHPFKHFLEGHPKAPDNVVFSDSPSTESYKMMMTCGYAVSAHSTAGVEALYYGMKTFFLDNQPSQYPFYFREFPQVCVRRPEEIVRRIRSIETGEENYPWESCEGLVELSNRYPFDIVRGKMGLPPKGGSDIAVTLQASRSHDVPAPERGIATSACTAV